MYTCTAQAPRIAEPKHSRQQIDRVRGDDVLRRNTVCTSVIVGYGVKMKRRLSAMCGLLLFFFEVDKDVVDPR